jgi:RND family efflux transporter MFP subunit
MDQRTALLDQLRISRNDIPPHPTGGRRRFRWWIGISAAVIAIAVAIALAQLTQRVPVRSVIARAAPASDAGLEDGSSLDASGYVVALREATVSGKSIYKVSEVLVQEGQPVKQGEIMARLDDTNARAALEQSQAQVRQLEAALAAARLAASDARPSYLRNRQQLAEGLISRDTFDASKASYDATQTAAVVAEQNLAVAKATVEVNRRYEDDTVIRAPFDGVVTVKSAQPGEIVSPQFSGGGGVAKIVDMDSLEVDVDVSESLINRVHANQPAAVTLNAYPDWRIPAEVIAIIPTADRAKATVKVRIGFRQKDARIVPEMGAHVSFLDSSHQNQAGEPPSTPKSIVPPAAIQANGDSGVVFVITGDRLKRETVRLGKRGAQGQTVVAGVQPGASLAVGDFGKLRDGMKVRVAP